MGRPSRDDLIGLEIAARTGVDLKALKNTKLDRAICTISKGLADLEHECHTRGLHLTAKKINTALNKLGWEAAELLMKGKS